MKRFLAFLLALPLSYGAAQQTTLDQIPFLPGAAGDKGKTWEASGPVLIELYAISETPASRGVDTSLGDPRFINDMKVEVTDVERDTTVFAKKYIFRWSGGKHTALDTVRLGTKPARYQLSYRFDTERLKTINGAFLPRIFEGYLRVTGVSAEKKSPEEKKEQKPSRYKVD